ncbi:hypothetical protein TruAng_002538 [Truncatella angustata]|nr:hypothetical protein TruAng_002538 [Truncatella angustata]
MLIRSTIPSSMALVFASKAIGAAMPVGQGVSPRVATMATDPVSACNCPYNCSHEEDFSCKYKVVVSTTVQPSQKYEPASKSQVQQCSFIIRDTTNKTSQAERILALMLSI